MGSTPVCGKRRRLKFVENWGDGDTRLRVAGLVYSGCRILIPAFPGSNPGAPANLVNDSGVLVSNLVFFVDNGLSAPIHQSDRHRSCCAPLPPGWSAAIQKPQQTV